MAYICTKDIACIHCSHYRLDEDDERMACWAEIDEREKAGDMHGAKS